MSNFIKKRSSILWSATGMLLLALYVIGSTQNHGFHEIFHHHDSAVHTADLEADACHRFIYHNDYVSGCGHDAHFTEPKECIWHDEIVSSHDLSNFALPLVRETFVSSYCSPHDKNFTSALDFVLPARGPPNRL